MQVLTNTITLHVYGIKNNSHTAISAVY